MSVCMRLFPCACVCLCGCVILCVCACTCICTSTWSYTCVCVCACTHVVSQISYSPCQSILSVCFLQAPRGSKLTGAGVRSGFLDSEQAAHPKTAFPRACRGVMEALCQTDMGQAHYLPLGNHQPLRIFNIISPFRLF